MFQGKHNWSKWTCLRKHRTKKSLFLYRDFYSEEVLIVHVDIIHVCQIWTWLCLLVSGGSDVLNQFLHFPFFEYCWFMSFQSSYVSFFSYLTSVLMKQANWFTQPVYYWSNHLHNSFGRWLSNSLQQIEIRNTLSRISLTSIVASVVFRYFFSIRPVTSSTYMSIYFCSCAIICLYISTMGYCGGQAIVNLCCDFFFSSYFQFSKAHYFRASASMHP